jgi:hypothetical protein
MKQILLSAFLILIFTTVSAQTNETHQHDRYCRHYPQSDEIPSYAYRNDWQSDLVHDYDVTFYFLDIEVSSTSIQVGGTVEIHGTVVADEMAVFAFELNSSLEVTI